MTSKEKVIDLVSKMPDSSTMDDIGYRLYVLESIEQGLAELNKGEYLSHDEAKRELGQWIEN
jgi:predicted transcriptional regulator